MKTLEQIFDNVELIGQTPNMIMKVQLPDFIFDEVKSWIDHVGQLKIMNMLSYSIIVM